MKNNILKSVELIESNKVNQLIDNLNLYLKIQEPIKFFIYPPDQLLF